MLLLRGNRSRESTRAAEQLRQGAEDRARKVLKPAQRDAYETLLGPSFDVA